MVEMEGGLIFSSVVRSDSWFGDATAKLPPAGATDLWSGEAQEPAWASPFFIPPVPSTPLLPRPLKAYRTN
jgi:hypothetical protein